MTDASDPPRLSARDAVVPQRVKELLDQAQKDGPSPSQLAALEARLAAVWNAPASVGGTPDGPNAAASAGGQVAGLGKWLAGAALLTAGGMVAAWPSNPEPVAPQPRPKSDLQQPLDAVPRAVPETTQDGRHQTDVRDQAAVDQSTLGKELALEPKASPGRRRSTARRRQARPRPSATPEARKPSSADPETQPRTQPLAASEAELLERARQALAADARAALRMTEQHQARFPNGLLTEEREVLAIEALGKLGRREALRGRIRAFSRRFAESAHRTSVEQVQPQAQPRPDREAHRR